MADESASRDFKGPFHMLTRDFWAVAALPRSMPVAAVGDDARAERDVTTDLIDRYAAVTGDDNPLHLDADYAEAGVFGGRVAHGMFTAGVVSAALADLPGDVVYLSQDLAFEAPVRPGTTVVAEVEVTEVIEGDRVRVDTTAEGDGETVLTGEATVMSVPHEA
jgi:3-hydroxybutyryl-CoA dehydratase